MSNLEKSIGDLSNEDIVNSILEDFQNDLTLNTSNSEESVKSPQSRKEPKIIELDDDDCYYSDPDIRSNETILLETSQNEAINDINQLELETSQNDISQNEPNNGTRNSQLETSQNENNSDTNTLLKLSENESGKSNSKTSQEDNSRGVNTNSDMTNINREKDFDEEIVSKNDEDEDHLSEDEGVDDSELSEEEIKNSEQSAIELKNQGNDLFKQHLWSESLAKYNEALRKCPKSCSTTRAICHANRAAVYEKMDKTDESIAACSRSLALNPTYVKVYTRRARLYQTSDKLDEALADYQKILELDPTNRDAYLATKTLPQQINERNEKLKEEMMGKLKDLGNMILRPFGLSTNNFQMVQDPNSGGYSINFQQNAPPPNNS
uniref:Tetratricopeptide repeat protein 1 n=1 Tax=Cacopsylla melanoneura TaxID=428564 RepID=A0A8D8UDN5_9HEMI